MAPIRLAIIGLSSSATTSWASNAHLPYLLSARGREKYQIVALCNSSIEAAQRAIAAFKLPPATRAYGDPQAVADDTEIDLVVNCTRVDVHHRTILPSVKAGKSVFVEWPLAQDIDHVRELAAAAKASGSRSIVGLQGRVAPVILKLRELLHQNRIGKILSSEVRAAGGTMDRELIISGLSYFTQRAVGGNVFTIGFGHLFDQIQHVLGELVGVRAHLQVQRPEVKIRDASTQKITETRASNVPDLIVTTSSLQESTISRSGATVLTRFRRGQPFHGEPPLVWTINGEKGEIRLTAHGGAALQANVYSAPVVIEVHDFEKNTAQQVDWIWPSWQEELPIPARNIAVLYDNFADGKREGIPSFENALARHEQLERILADWDSSL